MAKRLFLFLAFVSVIGLLGLAARSDAQGATPAATQVVPCGTAEASQTFTRFNLNTGTPEQFLTIPQMNQRWVREFLEYRPYISITQFRKEIGKYVGADQVAA